MLARVEAPASLAASAAPALFATSPGLVAQRLGLEVKTRLEAKPLTAARSSAGSKAMDLGGFWDTASDWAGSAWDTVSDTITTALPDAAKTAATVGITNALTDKGARNAPKEVAPAAAAPAAAAPAAAPAAAANAAKAPTIQEQWDAAPLWQKVLVAFVGYKIASKLIG